MHTTIFRGLFKKIKLTKLKKYNKIDDPEYNNGIDKVLNIFVKFKIENFLNTHFQFDDNYNTFIDICSRLEDLKQKEIVLFKEEELKVGIMVINIFLNSNDDDINQYKDIIKDYIDNSDSPINQEIVDNLIKKIENDKIKLKIKQLSPFENEQIFIDFFIFYIKLAFKIKLHTYIKISEKKYSLLKNDYNNTYECILYHIYHLSSLLQELQIKEYELFNLYIANFYMLYNFLLQNISEEFHLLLNNFVTKYFTLKYRFSFYDKLYFWYYNITDSGYKRILEREADITLFLYIILENKRRILIFFDLFLEIVFLNNDFKIENRTSKNERKIDFAVLYYLRYYIYKQQEEKMIKKYSVQMAELGLCSVKIKNTNSSFTKVNFSDLFAIFLLLEILFKEEINNNLTTYVETKSILYAHIKKKCNEVYVLLNASQIFYTEPITT